MEKIEIRNTMMQMRLNQEQNGNNSHEIIMARVSRFIEPGMTVALVCSFGAEINTHPLLKHLFRMGENVVCLPRVEGKEMAFYAVSSWDQLLKSKMGIMEPNPMCSRYISPEEIDLIIVPMLAFNTKGFRIGYGGGYYDRYISNPQVHAQTVGFAYDFQKTSQQFQTDRDIPCDIIVTERHLYDMKRL